MEEIRSKQASYEVSPLELLFDLVIVFACMELTKHLMGHFTYFGILEILILLVAVYNLWTYTSFGSSLIQSGNISSRGLIFVIMLLGIFMNTGIEEAFEEGAWLFIVPYLMSQLGQGIYIMVRAKDKGLRSHYGKLTIWTLITVPLWVIGAIVQDDLRLILWGIAALIDLMGLLLAHPAPFEKRNTEHIPFNGEHTLERCRLFLIIAIGEAVFSLIEALMETSKEPVTLLLGIASFLTIISFWAMYFWGSDHLLVRHVEETKNPLRTAHLTMNSLFVALVGLILFSVGTRIIIEQGNVDNSRLLALIFFGGPALYLASQGWYTWYVLKHVPVVRITFTLLLIGLGLLSFLWHTYVSLIIVMLLMLILTTLLIRLNKNASSHQSSKA